MRTRHATLACFLALGAGAPALAAAARDAGPDPSTVGLQRAVAQLRQEHTLASSKGFYLRLDATSQRLALMLRGVALDDYAASALEWGVPEVLFVDRRPAADWDLASFSRGHLDPARERDRMEIVAPPLVTSAASPAESAPTSAPPIPKSAEETYSVPSPYRIVFAEGVSLEVRAKGHGGRNRTVVQRLVDATRLRLSDLATALSFGARERVRLSVTLEADDAAALYRSLPPDVGLIAIGLPPP
jgi:hypothetical protein